MTKLPDNQDLKTLQEAKLIFVGQGAVGKTSLIKKLLYGYKLDNLEKQTKGISIYEWEIVVNKLKINVHIWDFGGQEIMHTTHQFFLTEKSLYVLVLDSRIEEDENRLEYWLKIIQSFGGKNVPVILVGNKLDYQSLHINKTGLQTKYPDVIKSIIETSCLDGRGIEELRIAIKREISKLSVVHQKIDPTWFDVKNSIKQIKQDFISFETFARFCKSKGVEDERYQRQLGELLHDLGVVLNFHKEPTLEDAYILNPIWVTEGVYGIINSNQLFQEKGVIEFDKLMETLDPEKYPPNKVQFLIELMRKFELCYEFDDTSKKKYFVPALLEYKENYMGDWSGALEFEYHYNILPSSVLSRFIVRMHPYIEKNTVWRNGVLLSHDQCLALVKADYERKRITISILGNNSREFLSSIRMQINSINKTFPYLEFKEMVPIPNYPSATPVEYNFLREMERNHRKDFPINVEEKIIDVKVDELLNRIEMRLPITKTITSNDRNTISQLVIASFYLFVFLIVFSIIAFVSTKIAWQTLVLAPIIGLVLVIVTASVGLLSIGQLNQDNFTSIITNALSRIPYVDRFIKK